MASESGDNAGPSFLKTLRIQTDSDSSRWRNNNNNTRPRSQRSSINCSSFDNSESDRSIVDRSELHSALSSADERLAALLETVQKRGSSKNTVTSKVPRSAGSTRTSVSRGPTDPNGGVIRRRGGVVATSLHRAYFPSQRARLHTSGGRSSGAGMAALSADENAVIGAPKPPDPEQIALMSNIQNQKKSRFRPKNRARVLPNREVKKKMLLNMTLSERKHRKAQAQKQLLQASNEHLRFIEQLWLDRNGKTLPDDFIPSQSEKLYRRIFDAIDLNGDQSLDPAEIANAFHYLGVTLNQHDIIDEFGTDLDFHRFCQWIHRRLHRPLPSHRRLGSSSSAVTPDVLYRLLVHLPSYHRRNLIQEINTERQKRSTFDHRMSVKYPSSVLARQSHWPSAFERLRKK